MAETGSRFGGSSGKQIAPSPNEIAVVDSLASEMWELERREMHQQVRSFTFDIDLLIFGTSFTFQIIQQRTLLDKYTNLDESYSQLKSRNEFLEEKCSALEKRLQQQPSHSASMQIVTEIDEVTTTVFGPNVSIAARRVSSQLE